MLSDVAMPRMVFQPIVDTERGVVAGYEALARFDVDPELPPDAWFAAATELGCGGQLEARALRAALAVRGSLPPNCFLSVNLSPHLLNAPEVRRVVSGRDLRGVVVELTERVPYGTDPRLLAAVAELRRAGAMIALDDAGSGYSGLQQLLSIRPEIVKLDRGLIAGADADEAKLALVGMVGEFAARIDAWLLAEGVETEGELVAVRRLGVPLAQGWFSGHPAAPWAGVPEGAQRALGAVGGRPGTPDEVGALIEDVPALRLGDPLTDGWLPSEDVPTPARACVAVAVDTWSRPLALLLPARSDRGRSAARNPRLGYRVIRPVLRVAPSAGVAETALRAMTRAAPSRFDPVVCTDVEGRLIGVVRVERLVTRLAAQGGRT